MKKRFLCLFLGVTILLVGTTPLYACRFWVASSKSMPDQIVREQLLGSPYSLKQLGDDYKDGWSVAFYAGSTILVMRSEKPADKDETFDQAVNLASGADTDVIIGHLRQATSGCSEGVPNPHPFQRYHKGHHWLFGHNGGIEKELLISLISMEYLNAHPPQACNENPPQSWVDSELYFIYLLKKIEDANGNVLKGLKSAISELSSRIAEPDRFLNFFLTDGKDVWAYREGMDLSYAYDRKNNLSVISSTAVGDNLLEWKEFPKGNIALLRPHRKPKFYAPTK